MNDLVTIRRAIISVSDKTGLIEFARALARREIEIISTGGTAAALEKAGIRVTPIDQITGFPEIMDGRVKTLHPKVHGALLAVRDDPSHQEALEKHDIAPIDLVCVNLYPFERTIAATGVERDEAIEQIDIGGPSMIRSASKNHDWVTVVVSPDQYEAVVGDLNSLGGKTSLSLRRDLAAAAFRRTSAYDAAIANYLGGKTADTPGFSQKLGQEFSLVQELRYGENPHQKAALYANSNAATSTIPRARQLHGKELGYNNIADAAGALELVRALKIIAPDLAGAAVIKHANPCGCAIAKSAFDALENAIAGDPLAAYGGIIALSAPVELKVAERLCRDDTFAEVLIAPSFAPEAVEAMKKRWFNMRILEVGPIEQSKEAELEQRSIPGGLLVQTRDALLAAPKEFARKAGPEPKAETIRIAQFMEVTTRAIASNAVAIGGLDPKSGVIRLFGAGAGQMDRLTSCRLAAQKAGALAKGAVAFSDAFFPFPDGPQVLIDAGVAAIVHPGGSKRDQETFDLCEKRGVTCITTGLRHFRH
ncbi:MAG: bifunctional phosphoribosylaminoimidazolecarboxamide formyltransferase/IMP cyclohydrolase [Phycisphaeraceae bacterium]|nr:bifunctional phosphoribosylaminoimidazolecarboxamide formyltransferase/IMP cyclohydrolase [Phycisphaeraceae bacterium]